MKQKALTYKATMHRLKSMFFYQLTPLSNNHVLMSYLGGFYLESWFSWLGGRVQKTLKRRRKETEQKRWIMKRKNNEEYKESQMTTINIFGFTFYIQNYILLESLVWKKAIYTITFYLQFLFVAGYLKRSNDTLELNIHKHTNYNIIEYT